MNKILVENDCILEAKDSYLIDITNDANIKIKVLTKDIYIMLFTKNHVVNLEIEVLKNNSLILNSLGINATINYNCNLQKNSSFICSNSILTSINSVNKIKLVQNENTNVKFYANGINENNSKLYFDINGIISKTSTNSYLEETSKIINLADGDSKIIPNLIIDTKEVVANHSAYIGVFDKDQINYLKSRGIEENAIRRLLIKSILLFKMEKDSNDIFIKELENI